MAKFLDEQGRTFELQLNVASAKRLKATLGVDLLDLLNGNQAPLVALVNNPFELVDALYLLCEADCQRQSVSDEEFGRGLAGEAIERAVTALLEAIVDFFPPGRRPVMKGILDKLAEAEARMTTRTIERIQGEAGNRLIEAAIQQAESQLDRTLEEQIKKLTAGGNSKS